MLGIEKLLHAPMRPSNAKETPHEGAAAIPTQMRIWPTYWIAPHVHVRNTQDGCVVLDLARDKYVGLTKDESMLLAATVYEWPAALWQVAGESRTDTSSRSRALCESLLEDGLICESPPANACSRHAPEMDLQADWVCLGDEIELPSLVTVRDVANFVLAFVAAWASLRFGRLERTVDAIRRSRDCARHGDSSMTALQEASEPMEILRMARAVDIFRRLRTFVFAAEGRCLLHALALIKFMGRYHLHPRWVIGISTQPWGAHSWVQWQKFLLDTTPEKVGRYLPILVV